MKKQDTILLGREREMRDRLRRERDREIETVIQKLEEETAASKEECERNAEMRIRQGNILMNIIPMSKHVH